MTAPHGVIDASVVVDLLVGPDRAEVLDALPKGAWHAPSLLDVEVVSALRGLVLGGHLSRPRAYDALGDFDDLGFTRWPVDSAVRTRLLDLADNLSAYDATYVVLGQALDAPLLTRDRRLAAAARGMVKIQSV